MANPVGYKTAWAVTTGCGSSATAKEELGAIRVETNGDAYKYIKATTTVTQYYIAMAVSTDGYTVTNGQTTQFSPMGVAVTTLNGTYPYGWIKCRGPFTVAKYNNVNITQYYPIAQCATAGQCSLYNANAGDNAGKYLGYALAAATTTITSITAYIDCL